MKVDKASLIRALVVSILGNLISNIKLPESEAWYGIYNNDMKNVELIGFKFNVLFFLSVHQSDHSGRYLARFAL